MRGWLAAEYAYINSQLIGVLMVKPEKWKEIRYNGEVKSDTAAERIWQSTPEGLNETVYRMKLKTIEKLLSAVKSRMEVMRRRINSEFFYAPSLPCSRFFLRCSQVMLMAS